MIIFEVISLLEIILAIPIGGAVLKIILTLFQ
jgi:hypothetical protein